MLSLQINAQYLYKYIDYQIGKMSELLSYIVNHDWKNDESEREELYRTSYTKMILNYCIKKQH